MENASVLRPSSMGPDIEYLLIFLKDELRDLHEIRISATFPSSTRKSPDLLQDYDPNSNDLHVKRGVTVRARSRDYFFPASWARDGHYDQVRELALEIREFAGNQD